MWKSTLPLLVLLVSLASSSSACSVVIDNVDVTLDLFVGDDSNDGGNDGNNGYVNCTGTYRCKNAVIMGCDRIHCMENEACQFANIEFTESVTCSGLHACHGANLTHVPTSVTEPSVVCQGTGACDVATISGPEASSLRVTCYGGKACRKALITANSIHCTQGDSRNQACMGFASLITNCLVCGVRGCADHINQCRYKSSTIAEQDYVPCQAETLIGTCDNQLEHVFQMEVSGEEQGNEGEEGGR